MLPLGAQNVISVQNGCMINFKNDLSDKLNPENIEKLGWNLPKYGRVLLGVVLKTAQQFFKSLLYI